MLADQRLCSVHASIAAFQYLIGLRFGEFGSQIKALRSVFVFLCYSTMVFTAFCAFRVRKSEKLLLAKADARSSMKARRVDLKSTEQVVAQAEYLHF